MVLVVNKNDVCALAFPVYIKVGQFNFLLLYLGV